MKEFIYILLVIIGVVLFIFLAPYFYAIIALIIAVVFIIGIIGAMKKEK